MTTEPVTQEAPLATTQTKLHEDVGACLAGKVAVLLLSLHDAIEPLLYRVAKSQHVDRFILKGAILLMTWFDEPFRSARVLDLLVYGDSTTEKRLPPIGPRSQSTRP